MRRFRTTKGAVPGLALALSPMVAASRSCGRVAPGAGSPSSASAPAWRPAGDDSEGSLRESPPPSDASRVRRPLLFRARDCAGRIQAGCAFGAHSRLKIAATRDDGTPLPSARIGFLAGIACPFEDAEFRIFGRLVGRPCEFEVTTNAEGEATLEAVSPELELCVDRVLPTGEAVRFKTDMLPLVEDVMFAACPAGDYRLTIVAIPPNTVSVRVRGAGDVAAPGALISFAWRCGEDLSDVRSTHSAASREGVARFHLPRPSPESTGQEGEPPICVVAFLPGLGWGSFEGGIRKDDSPIDIQLKPATAVRQVRARVLDPEDGAPVAELKVFLRCSLFGGHVLQTATTDSNGRVEFDVPAEWPKSLALSPKAPKFAVGFDQETIARSLRYPASSSPEDSLALGVELQPGIEKTIQAKRP